MANSNFFICAIVVCLISLIIEVTDGLIVPSADSRTCIIGAGFSGLATARYLLDYGVQNFTVFEATKHVGGTWRFDPHVGMDEDGLPLFTHMYRGLRTNTPRQTMEFPGYPMPEDTPSYPAGTCYYKYLKSFTKHFGLMKYIQLQSLVTTIKRENDHWRLTYTKVDTRTNHSEDCNFVVIAHGHYQKLNWPKIRGQESFKGHIIHSHDYKEPEVYKNRRVLLVGAGASGLDLATQLVEHADKLVHSHHLVYNQPNFPKSYMKKPDIRKFTEDGVEFVDGSFEKVDEVIFCTGYDFDFPFLDATSGVTVSGKFVLPLYQQTVNIRHPSMFFVGITKATINRVNDAQGEYCAAVISGKFQLPPQEEMLRSWLRHVYHLPALGKKIVDVNYVGHEMDQFFANLTQEAGVGRAPPVLTKMRDFNAKNRLEDLLNYRDYDYNIIDEGNYERIYNPRKILPCSIED